MRFGGLVLRMRRFATGQSCASPPVNRMAMRRPLASASAWIFVLRPPRERPTACFCSPLTRPAHEPVIDCRRRAIGFRAITPAAAALEHMHDAADHAPVVCSLDAAHVRRQVGLDPTPLLIAQPKQVLAHGPRSLPKTNQDRI